MNEVFLDYNGIRLLNLPHGRGAIYDEVLVQDCYRLDTIPKDSIVLDVGGILRGVCGCLRDQETVPGSLF